MLGKSRLLQGFSPEEHAKGVLSASERRFENRPALQRRLPVCQYKQGSPSRRAGVKPQLTYKTYFHVLTAPFTPTLRDGPDLKSYETGAEAPAYFLSAPPDFAKALS